MVSSPGPGFEFGTDGPSLILVGIDGSRTSLRAAAHAGGLASAPEHLGHRVLGSLAARLVRAGKWPVIVVP